ncbi:MAG: sigma-70 family RNA polymerase sigma factor [Pirellulales bacterium]|nr:sigma-70 family RNA polymerase sigma factor [Pirellulales bacterium]
MGRSRRKMLPSSRRVEPLIAAARDGSDLALGQLLNAYRPFLLSVAAEEFDSKLKAKAGPSDVVQDTFIEAQRDFGKFKSDSAEELRIWLHTLLMNNLVDLRRRYLRAAKRQVRRERPLGVADSKAIVRELVANNGQSPSRQAVSREELACVEAALGRLPPAYRQAIIMRSQERQSFTEIGQAIGKSSAAARMLWKRAMLKLKRELGASHGDQ